MNKRYLGIAALILWAGATITSCKKDPVTPVTPTYTVPATYSFENVEYSEASGRVSMWAGLTSYLGKGTGRRLSQDTVNNLWLNTGSSFTAEIASNLPHSITALNAFTFNVSGKVSDAATFKQYIDSQVAISAYFTATASQGIPGKVGTRLVNYSGLEFNQIVAKGMMGALQVAQAIACLNKVAADDNNTVTAGSGTAMQHDWDLAFGYAGLPTDYDSAKDYASTEANRPLAIGDYFRERGQYINAGGTVYEAFRKGRAAINNKDYVARDAAAATIKLTMEKTLAAAAYEYMTISTGSSDLAARFHALSEGYGFIIALKYRQANSPLNAANYEALSDIMKTNFYTLTADASNTKVTQAKTILTTAYGQLQP